MKKKKYIITNSRGFTFIELIISISIIAILSILWFMSYSKNLEDTRDSQRESDLAYISNALKLHKTKRWNYPFPWESFNIVNSWTLLAIQWKMSDNVILSTIDSIPLDPFAKVPYMYSIWRNNQEFQLAATLENNWANKSFVIWDFKVVSKNVLPSILLALHWSWNVEINENVWEGSINRTKFIFNNSSNNLPYIFEAPFVPYSNNNSFTGLLIDPKIVLEQNNDFKNCNDIYNGDKNIWTWEYQVNNYGTLENITCNSSVIPKNCKEIKEAFSWSISTTYTIMPEWVSRPITVYCDMTTASWWWTLVAKDGDSLNYTIGHCNFMDAPTSTSKAGSPYTYWACDLNQTEMLFWTPTWWIIWTNKDKEDCWTRASKVNNNTCSWTWTTSQTFKLTTQSWWCVSNMTGTLSPNSWWLWWKWWDWGTGVTKNLSWLSTTLNWSCNNALEENTSYCSLFDIYNNSTWNWIWQWRGYRWASCAWWYTDWAISPESHLIFVR